MVQDLAGCDGFLGGHYLFMCPPRKPSQPMVSAPRLAAELLAGLGAALFGFGVSSAPRLAAQLLASLGADFFGLEVFSPQARLPAFGGPGGCFFWLGICLAGCDGFLGGHKHNKCPPRKPLQPKLSSAPRPTAQLKVGLGADLSCI